MEMVNVIRREQGLVEVKQANFIAGDKPSKRTKNSVYKNGLINIFLSYLHRSPMKFLQRIAQRLTLGRIMIIIGNTYNDTSISYLCFIALSSCFSDISDILITKFSRIYAIFILIITPWLLDFVNKRFSNLSRRITFFRQWNDFFKFFYSSKFTKN